MNGVIWTILICLILAVGFGVVSAIKEGEFPKWVLVFLIPIVFTLFPGMVMEKYFEVIPVDQSKVKVYFEDEAVVVSDNDETNRLRQIKFLKLKDKKSELIKIKTYTYYHININEFYALKSDLDWYGRELVEIKKEK